MTTVAGSVDQMAESKTGEILRQVARLCWQNCNTFLDWERDHVLKANPSSDLLRRHRQELKWLIRLVMLLQTVASDPEFPDRSITEDFKALLERLDRSWQLIQEPGMSDTDADAVLRECFPNGPGT